eukprot:2235218-Pyramimonas_sp.AAC.1
MRIRLVSTSDVDAHRLSRKGGDGENCAVGPLKKGTLNKERNPGVSLRAHSYPMMPIERITMEENNDHRDHSELI